MKPTGFTAALLTLCLTTATPAAADIALDLGDGVKLELVQVKKGTFQQGSPPTEAGRGDDERLHPVTLTRDFYLGKYPVTRGQFARFVKETGYRTEAERGPSGGFGWDGTKLVQRKEFTWRNPGFVQTDNHPVTLVTYDDALAFTAWLAKKTGRPVSLPTEAQWEYACRAGTTSRFYAGDTDADARAIAWFKDNAGDGTRPVGRKKPNGFGLYDMSGNVFQWCRDWYGAYPDGAVDDPEQTRADAGEPRRRVLRGGSWLREAKHARSAARYRNTPGSRNADNGFRVAVPLTTPPQQQEARQVGVPLRAGRQIAIVALPVTAVVVEAFSLAHFCILIFFAGFFLMVILVILRALGSRNVPGRPPPRRQTPPRYSTRVVHDGFWVDAPSYPPGSVIHYRYRSGGQWRTGSCPIQPGPQGHFIYTGGQPADIEIDRVVPPASAGGDFDWNEPSPPTAPPTGEPLISEPSATPGESAGDFPSAY